MKNAGRGPERGCSKPKSRWRLWIETMIFLRTECGGVMLFMSQIMPYRVGIDMGMRDWSAPRPAAQVQTEHQERQQCFRVRQATPRRRERRRRKGSALDKVGRTELVQRGAISVSVARITARRNCSFLAGSRERGICRWKMQVVTQSVVNTLLVSLITKRSKNRSPAK